MSNKDSGCIITILFLILIGLLFGPNAVIVLLVIIILLNLIKG